MILPSWVLPVAAVNALLLTHSLAYNHGVSVEKARHEAETANQQIAEHVEVRGIENESQGAVDSAGEQAHAELEQARADAAIAASTADGLRVESKRLSSRLASCNSSVAAEREARERAAAELANVLAEMESEGRAMAEAATRSRASGLACEAAYDGVRSSRLP